MCRQHFTPFHQLAQLAGMDHTDMLERVVKRRSLADPGVSQHLDCCVGDLPLQFGGRYTRVRS